MRKPGPAPLLAGAIAALIGLPAARLASSGAVRLAPPVPLPALEPLHPTLGEDEALPDSAASDEDETDVLVIGSGPAGMAAALAAEELGVEVTVIERASRAGEGILYGGRYLGVGTDWQEAAGVTDSPAIAEDEWETITGAPGSAPAVITYLEATAETLSWLEGLGLSVTAVRGDDDGGEVERIHELDGDTSREGLLAAFEGDLRTGVEVDELIVASGRVVGARWTELESGETGELRARAVVVATGGFLRDRDLVEAWRPELAGRRLVYETNPQSDGGGHGLLTAAGAATQAMENTGIYVHGMQDPEMDEGEALVVRGLSEQLVVDEAGARFEDEQLTTSLDLFDALPDGEIWMITTDERSTESWGARPAYNWAVSGESEDLSLEKLSGLSEEVVTAATLAELAALIDVDPDGLAATIDEVNDHIALGETDAWGRDFSLEEPFETDLWWAVRLTPGLAKAFGGVATDQDAAALDADGVAIPGLYAASEVAGMVPQGGAGTGFAGSVSACYVFGRIAGTNAALEALGSTP